MVWMHVRREDWQRTLCLYQQCYLDLIFSFYDLLLTSRGHLCVLFPGIMSARFIQEMSQFWTFIKKNIWKIFKIKIHMVWHLLTLDYFKKLLE